MKKKKQPTFTRLLARFNNKYILTFLGFLIWLSFFDRNDFITIASYRSQLNKLKAEKEFYELEIERNKANIHNLRTNKENLEKFAREEYFMKKKNEEVFVILAAKD